MNKILLKYNSLDAVLQRQVEEFIDFLLTVKSKSNGKGKLSYKQKILKVSTWKENDLRVFDETKKSLQQWNIQEW